MYYCDTNQKIVAVLAGAKATSDCPFVTTVVTTANVPSAKTGTTNGTTQFDLTDAACGMVRHISIYNADTAAITVTVKYSDNGTLYILKKAVIPVGCELIFDSQLGGWSLVEGGHGLSHTDGSDDVQTASTSQLGVLSAANFLQLAGITGVGWHRLWNFLTDPIDASPTGTWARELNNAELYEADLWNSSTADADSFGITTRCPAGTYTLNFNYRKSTDGGIVETLADAVSQGTVDTYAASATYLSVCTYSGIVLAEGAHTITFLLSGKNASSSDYVFRTHAMCLTRTA